MMIRKLQGGRDFGEFTVEELTHDLLSGFAARAIRKKARQLARGRNQEEEREDLRQKFQLHLFQQFKKFRPERAHWNVYAKTLIERHAATLAKNTKAGKRRVERGLVSLDAPVEDRKSRGSLGDCVSSERRAARLGVYPSSHIEEVDARLDAETLTGKLGSEGSEIFERVKESSVSAAGRDLNIPRTTLRRKIAQHRKNLG